MKKMLLFTFLIIFPSFAYTQTSNIPYWYMDVTVEKLYGTTSIQRVYFFRNLQSMNNATGFPNGDDPGGAKTSYQWKQFNGSSYAYHEQIYSQMSREGFEVAFILDASGRAIDGVPYYNYTVYLLRNGIKYYDFISRYGRPVRL